MNAVEFKSVTKAFQGFTALNALNITVPQGSVYGLLGPNGAGKTTAIRHLTGMLRPDLGEVLVSGEPVYENPAVKERLFCIPEDPYFFPLATTGDMMRFFASVYPRFDASRFNALRQAFPVAEELPIRRLSRGMRKQAAFWLALSARPEVLVLDEPVDGLDPVMRRQVWSLIMADVAENETTVLVSSHNLRELEDVCDRVGILQKGRCILERDLAALEEKTVKVLASLPEGTELPSGLEVLHRSAVGRLQTLILRGGREEILAAFAPLYPAFLETQPLTLEEIFIYELGGADYAVKELLL